ncbi:MAG TPA: hypothetical protein VGE40_03000 [Bacilli bacterium]
MNLAEMLSYADIQQLSKIAVNYECECNGHSKNELIQSILSAVNRREVFDKYIQGMSPEDLRFLNSLLFDQRESFSLEEMIARVQQTKFIKEDNESWNPREVIAKFKQRGWLFNGYSQQTKYLFQVPKDLKRRFSDVLTSRFLTSLHTIEEPGVYRDEQKIAAEDIYHFLRFVHHQDVALTTDGSMYKRQIQQILDGFTVKEDPVTKSGWRFGYGRRFKEYPNRLSFIYDYCFYNTLINEEDNKLTLTEKGLKLVLAEKREDSLQIYRLWLRLYKGPIHNMQSIVHWIDRLCRKWVTLDSLRPVLCKFIKPFYYDSPEIILEQRILQMMMHLGLVRIGEDEQHGTVVQVTKLGSSMINGTYISEEETIEIKS